MSRRRGPTIAFAGVTITALTPYLAVAGRIHYVGARAGRIHSPGAIAARIHSPGSVRTAIH